MGGHGQGQDALDPLHSGSSVNLVAVPRPKGVATCQPRHLSCSVNYLPAIRGVFHELPQEPAVILTDGSWRPAVRAVGLYHIRWLGHNPKVTLGDEFERILEGPFRPSDDLLTSAACFLPPLPRITSAANFL